MTYNFAKRHFKGIIKLNVVVFHNCGKNLEDIFHEYKVVNNYKNYIDNIENKINFYHTIYFFRNSNKKFKFCFCSKAKQQNIYA